MSAQPTTSQGANESAHHPQQHTEAPTAMAIAAPLTDEQLTLLTLRFDENEFGYLPNDASDHQTALHQIQRQRAQHEGTSPTAASPSDLSKELPAVAAAFVPYSAYDFVKEKQEHMSLEDLRTDLSTFSRLLENKIMQHIHEDVHEAFVTVSGQLGVMSEPLSRALQPLQGARKRLEKSVAHLDASEKAITDALNEGQRHEAARQFHVTMLQLTLTYESACRVYTSLVGLQQDMHLVVPPNTVGGGVAKGGYTLRPAAAASSSAAGGAVGSTIAPDESTLRPKKWHVAAVEEHDGLIESLAQHVSRLRAMWESLPLAAAFCTPLRAAAKGALVAPTTTTTATTDGTVANNTTTMANKEALLKVRAEIEAANASRQEAFAMVEETNKALQLVLGTALYDAYLASLGMGSNANITNTASSANGATSYYTDPSTTTAGLRRFSHFLNVYKQLGDDKELAVVYRDVIVRPMIETVVSWKAVGEARKSTAMVTQILRNIRQLLSTKVMHIVPLLRETFGGSINPISDIIWTAVCDTLVKRLVFLFSPTLPDVLHSNFTAAQEVLALLEEHCVTPQELYALRNGGDMPMWLRKWNLDIYHVQRSQEFNDAFEQLFAAAESNQQGTSSSAALPAIIANPNTAASPIAPTNVTSLVSSAANAPAVQSLANGTTSLYAYHYTKAFEGLSELSMKVFGKNVFLLPLGARQLKLAVTVIHNGVTRMVECVRRVAHDRQQLGNKVAATTNVETSPFIPLCLLLADMTEFERFVRNDFVTVAKAAMGDGATISGGTPTTPAGGPTITSGVTSHALAGLFKATIATVADKRNQLITTIKVMLLEGALLPLQQSLSSATTKANVANAPCPSEASRLISEAVAVFHQFASLGGSNGVISAEVCQTVLEATAKDLCAQYQSAAANALQGLHRRRKALQKVKLVANTTNTNANAEKESREVNDFEKAVLQLYYDAKQLEADLCAYVSVPMTGAAGGSDNSTVFAYYFAPLVERGHWIITNKINGAMGLNGDLPPAPALWAEVNEN